LLLQLTPLLIERALRPVLSQDFRGEWKYECYLVRKMRQKLRTNRGPAPTLHHGGRGRRGYRREYLCGRGVQWLRLKPRDDALNGMPEAHAFVYYHLQNIRRLWSIRNGVEVVLDKDHVKLDIILFSSNQIVY
jgi:hypothetical protein